MSTKIKIDKIDRKWLKRQYGKDWRERLAQHIRAEIYVRKNRDKEYNVQGKPLGR